MFPSITDLSFSLQDETLKRDTPAKLWPTQRSSYGADGPHLMLLVCPSWYDWWSTDGTSWLFPREQNISHKLSSGLFSVPSISLQGHTGGQTAARRPAAPPAPLPCPYSRLFYLVHVPNPHKSGKSSRLKESFRQRGNIWDTKRKQTSFLGNKKSILH